MIDGTFDVAIDTPKLHRRGTLTLQSNGDAIAARLTAGSLDDATFVGTCADKEFTFEGSGEYGMLGQIDFTAKGEVWGNSIDVKAETSAGIVTIFGTRLSASTGGVKSSHDYIMSASTGEFGAHDGTMYSGRFADGG